MANLNFRSDVSMQDVDVPGLVLFYMMPKPSTVAIRLPVPAPYLEQTIYKSNVAGSKVSRPALKITCRQDIQLDRPAPLLSIGSDPIQCGLLLERRYADPVHCQIYAQLNSGFDVWIIEDDSANGTLYRRRKDGKDCQNIDQAEELETEELIRKDRKAVQGLRYIRIGPYEFDCLPSEINKEIADRERWFRRHEPLPVTSQMYLTQLAGRKPEIQDENIIGEGGFGEVFKSMEMRTGLLVAVKKQKVGNDRGVGNVLREIRSMENLDHQNVVKILHSYQSFPEDRQRVYHLVMPLFPCSLRNALPMMKTGNKRNAMIQMVEGVKYIHRSGFLHRDIKPENIFISEQTPTNIVLGDLGLLSPVGAIGQMAGTNIYKAPEVYFHPRQTAAIDTYALGITFLQVLDNRSTKSGWQGLKQWVEDLWDHPPPSPFSNLIVQMTAPYPYTLRPSLDTIHHLLLHNKDLPESVERPQLNLKETMKMLEQKHAPSAKFTPRIPMVVPIARPAPLRPPIKHVHSRIDPQLYGIGAPNIFEKRLSNRAGPLDLVHKARGLTPRGPPVATFSPLKSASLEQTLPDATLQPMQKQSNQASSTGRVDFTKASVEPNNISTRQRMELLEFQLKAKERMLDKRIQEFETRRRQFSQNVRAYRRGRGRRREASGPCREPCPGEWPSRPTYSGAGSYRVSQSANDASQNSIFGLTSSDPHLDGVSHRSIDDSSFRRIIAPRGRHARARISNHARYDKRRIDKRAHILSSMRILQGLTLALKTGAGGLDSTITKGVRWVLGL